MKKIVSETLPDELILNIILFLSLPEIASFRSTSTKIKNLDLSRILPMISLQLSERGLSDPVLYYFRLNANRNNLQWKMTLESLPLPVYPIPREEFKLCPDGMRTIILNNQMPTDQIFKECSQSIMRMVKQQRDEKSKENPERHCLVM